MAAYNQDEEVRPPMSIARVLIAYDGSTGGEAIFDDLALAGLPEQAEALVLTVADIWMPAHDAPQGVTAPALIAALHQIQARAEDELLAARASAEAAAARVSRAHPGWRVDGEALADSPAWGVIQRAEAWPADLVIVGSHGRSGLGRFVLGSVSARLVHELRCGVRIARQPPPRPPVLPRILIGVDASPDAQAALKMVAARRWPPATETHVVVAVDEKMLRTVPPALLPSAPLAEGLAEQVARRATAALEAAGLSATYHVEPGDAARGLLRRAQEWGATSIFVGARGLSRGQRLLLGSVSTAVAMRAPCSVEIVRAH